MKAKIRLIFIVISLFVFLLGLFCNNFKIIYLSVLLLYFNVIVYAYRQKENGLIYFIFLISFFTFLLGSYTVNMLFGKDVSFGFSDSVNIHIQICLYIGLLGTYIGFRIANKKSIKQKDIYDIEKDNNIISIRKCAKILFFITLICKFIVVFERILSVQTHSYLYLYTEYVSKIPMLITKIAEANTFLMCIYLATMPNKKELKNPLILFLITETATILTGGRTKFVTAVLFIMGYYAYREYKSRKEKNEKYIWIKKRTIKATIIIAPVIIAFLGAYNIIRNNVKIENFNLGNEFIQFFEDQGGSVKLIGYVEEYKEKLPETNNTYVFGPITNFFKNGIIGKMLFNNVSFKGNTVEQALYGNNLGATMSYLVLNNRYLAGEGIGTQYIAETYVDFGYIGVFAFNVLIGYVMYIIRFRSDLKWFLSAIALSVIRQIIYMPRDFAMSWFSAFFSILNWGIILFVYLLSKFIHVKNNRIGE